MDSKLSRRELIKGTAVGASSVVLGKIPGVEGLAGLVAPPSEPSAEHAMPAAASDTPILPLTSTSDVFIPPHGGGFLKFSFDFPEPSVEFAGFRFSFRLFTFENTYAPDPNSMTVTKEADGI